MLGDPLPEGDPLTAAEVAALADATPIIVVWSGGNGPHRYTVARHFGRPWARTDHEPAHGRADLEGRSLERFVGLERCHTRVWLEPT
jgi:hypothetical protein